MNFITNAYARELSDLSAELNTVNADRFGLQTRVAELVAHCREQDDRLFALEAVNNALVTSLTELATRPLHRIVATRLALNALCVALAVKNSETVRDFVAFPKFAASHAVTTVRGLWARAGTRPDLGPSVS